MKAMGKGTAVNLWCPGCARRRSFQAAGPKHRGAKARRSRMQCESCQGSWSFSTDRRGRTVCEDWEPACVELEVEPPAALPSSSERTRELPRPAENDAPFVRVTRRRARRLER